MNTSGLYLHTRYRWLRNGVELLSSMRFAISALVMVAIASIIGTILKQNEAFVNYIDQFGPFWFEIFKILGLNNVYTASWFLLLMTLLLTSTALCVFRNTPKMLREIREFREHVREKALIAFPFHAEFTIPINVEQAAVQLQKAVRQLGYRYKTNQRENGALLLAAKKGSLNRLGYIFTHIAIVVICLGGLLDSGLPIKLQIWLQNKQPVKSSSLISEVPPSGRLSANNPTFRGNALIAEGQSTDLAIISYENGSLLQPLPFQIALKKFNIDFYSTGMPKLFASEVTVTDKVTGKQFPATIKVNEPLIYRGIAIYQSSFDDGGSRLQLTGYPMQGPLDYRFAVKGEVGGGAPLVQGNVRKEEAAYTVEFTGFRSINVENMRTSGKESMNAQVASVFNSAAHTDTSLRNIGPSVQYKIRDRSGQAREYHNYMLPIEIDGANWYLSGMRTRPGESFQYLRMPADQDGSLTEFMRLRAAFAQPALKARAANRFAIQAMAKLVHKETNAQEQLQESAQRIMDLFSDPASGGYENVARFITQTIRIQEQESAARLFLHILHECAWELWQLSRQSVGLTPMASTEQNHEFLQRSLTALSDSMMYGAPVYLQLKDFEEVKASVLQMTKSPGKRIVYIGSVFLVLGVFSMFYIREQRLWVQVKPKHTDSCKLLIAQWVSRPTVNSSEQFADLHQHIYHELIRDPAKIETSHEDKNESTS